MASPALVPDPAYLHLIRLEAEGQRITIVVTTTTPEARCPLCQRLPARVHAHYTRRVAALPWMGWAVQLRLPVRRFFCDHHACRCAIFTERHPTVAAPYARHTVRLAALLDNLGFALGGGAGEWLSATLGVPVSADTLLERSRTAPESAVPPTGAEWRGLLVSAWQALRPYPGGPGRPSSRRAPHGPRSLQARGLAPRPSRRGDHQA